jgi:peptidoglycan/xylan/chitin deacetylase (PgdA/CDA1 family)
MAVKTSLLAKVAVMAAVLVAGALPLLAGSPTSPTAAAFASLTSAFDDPPADTLLTAGRVINIGADHTSTEAIPKMPVTSAQVYPRFIVKKLKMTPSGLVDKSVQKSIKKCYNTTKDVWLTFDDGYTSQPNLSSILDTLRTYNVRGRFFLVGSWARKHPSMVNQIVAAGHFVENHTNTHAHLSLISDTAVDGEIRWGQPSNSHPMLLRPPYGDGVFTVRLFNLAQDHHYLLCDWGTDTRDWAGASAAMIVKRVVYGDITTPSAKAGGTVLMHLKNTQTRYALPTLIKAVRARGLTFDQLR